MINYICKFSEPNNDAEILHLAQLQNTLKSAEQKNYVDILHLAQCVIIYAILVILTVKNCHRAYFLNS